MERTEITTVEAIAGATQNEDLRRGQNSTAAPSWQWSIKCISGTCDDNGVARYPHPRVQPTDTVAADCRNRLDQQRLRSEVLPVTREPANALRKGDEHQVAAPRRSVGDMVETYRDTRGHVPHNEGRVRDEVWRGEEYDGQGGEKRNATSHRPWPDVERRVLPRDHSMRSSR